MCVCGGWGGGGVVCVCVCVVVVVASIASSHSTTSQIHTLHTHYHDFFPFQLPPPHTEVTDDRDEACSYPCNPPGGGGRGRGMRPAALLATPWGREGERDET